MAFAQQFRASALGLDRLFHRTRIIALLWQLQLAHDRAQMVQGCLSAAPPAQDHEIVRIGDEASAETLLKTELLPPQHKPAHVKIRQQW